MNDCFEYTEMGCLHALWLLIEIVLLAAALALMALVGLTIIKLIL